MITMRRMWILAALWAFVGFITGKLSFDDYRNKAERCRAAKALLEATCTQGEP